MKKEEKSWILYDVANSAFVLIVVTVIMPIFFKEYAAFGLTGAESTAVWGYANSAAALVIAIASPLMGVFADYQGFKMKMFLLFLVPGIIATLLTATVGQGAWIWCLAVFITARVAWSGTLVFYDSFLIDVSDEKDMDRISSLGYGWGYIGSVIPFLAVIFLVIKAGDTPDKYGAFKTGFVVTALWWLVFSIPMIKDVRQRFFVSPAVSPLKDGIARLVSGVREIRKSRKIWLFLLAYFFYIDGVDTIISRC
jgi:UMF1 family MFS transporter